MDKLNPEQRDFFKKTAELAFVNPFSEQRVQADCELLNIPSGTLDIIQRTEKILGLLNKQLHKLKGLNAFRIKN